MLFIKTNIFMRLFVVLLLSCIAFGGCAVPSDANVSQTAPPSPEQTTEPSPTAESTPEPKDSPDDLYIAISIFDAESYAEGENIKGIKELFEEKGVEYKLYDAKGDVTKQALQISEALDEEPDALIVSAGNAAISDLVNEAVSGELPVVYIKGYAPETADENLSPDEKNAVYTAAKEFKQSKKSGKTMLLSVEANANQDRENGLIEALMNEGINITVTKTVPSYEEGTHIVSTWMMAYPDFKGIWACSPAAVDSALYMKNLAGRDDIRIVGLSDKPEHLGALKEGLITAIIFPLYKQSGVYAAEAAIAAALNEEVPNMPRSFYKVYTSKSFENTDSPIAVYPPVDIKRNFTEAAD